MFFTHSISCCDQMSDNKNLRKERFILACGSRGTTPLWQGRRSGEDRQPARQTVSVLTKQCRNRKWGLAIKLQSSPLATQFLGNISTSQRFYILPPKHPFLGTEYLNSKPLGTFHTQKHNISFLQPLWVFSLSPRHLYFYGP